VIGSCGSTHVVASVEKVKTSRSCTPLLGETWKEPPSGGPFVVTTTLLVEPPQDRENVSLASSGSEDGASTRNTDATTGPVKAVDTGTRAADASLNEATSTDHDAMQDEAEVSVTLALKANCDATLIFCTLDVGVSKATRGADAPTIATPTEALPTRVSLDTVTVSSSTVPLLTSTPVVASCTAEFAVEVGVSATGQESENEGSCCTHDQANDSPEEEEAEPAVSSS
jgi:hypothetical protein